jgi:hypothetical protein
MVTVSRNDALAIKLPVTLSSLSRNAFHFFPPAFHCFSQGVRRNGENQIGALASRGVCEGGCGNDLS